MTITITGTNDAPVATANTNTIAEDAVSVSGNMLTDDDGFGVDSDIDGDTLSVTSIDNTGADQYGTLTLDNADGSYTYAVDNTNAAVQALGVGQTLTETYTYTVSDGNGGTDTATLTITINGVNDAPVVNATTVHVSEEGLTDGIADTTGLNAGDDTTDSTTASGNMASDIDGDTLTVSLSAPTQTITSGGNTVTWSGVGTNTLTGSANGTNVMTISVDSSGNYSVDLLAPVDHADASGEDTLSLTVGVTVDDGTTTASDNLTIVIEDDSPTAGNVSDTITLPAVDTNVQLILDVSGSMGTEDVLDVNDLDGDGDTTDYVSRLLTMQYAVNEMLTKYETLGNVRVNVVTYSTEGTEQSAGWVTAADAKTIVDGLTSGGVTNYDEGLMTTMETFDSSGSIVGAQNVSYFMTDGTPYYYQDWNNRSSVAVQGTSSTEDGIQTDEEVAWINFLQTHNVTSYAYVLGSGATAANINPIAYDGVNHTDTDGVVVTDLNDLDRTLRDTVVGASSGNIVSGSANIGFGADGPGNLTTLTIDGTTYTYDPATDTVSASGGTNNGTYDSTTNELTVETNLGGKFVINVKDGSYNYTASGDQTGVTETIDYAIIDNDGDPSGTGTLTLDIQAPVIGTPTIYTNTSDADQEITTDLNGSNVTTGTGNDWVNVRWIYNSSTLTTNAGEDLVSTRTVEYSAVDTGADDDRIYLLGDNSYEELVQATVNMGDGNDIFYFNFDLNSSQSQVYQSSTIDMGTGKDVLVFTQNNRTDFTFTNTASGLQITNTSNANIDFTVANAEHIYFVASDDSYNISTQQVNTGIVIDGIVKGLEYETSSGLSGYTRTDGEFDYLEGDTVTFKLGSVVFGTFSTDDMQDDKVFLQDLAGTSRTDVNDEYVENMAVLLQSLDVDGDAYNGIVITEEMRQALSDENFDLATIDSDTLKSIIESTGKEAVSETDAMEHVKDMLVEYANLDEEAFDARVETEEIEGKLTDLSIADIMPIVSVRTSDDNSSTAMAVGATIAGMYGTLVLAEDGTYVYKVDQEKAAKIAEDEKEEDTFVYTFEDGSSKEIVITVTNTQGSVVAEAQSHDDIEPDTTPQSTTDSDGAQAANADVIDEETQTDTETTEDADSSDDTDAATVAGVLTFDETTIDFASVSIHGDYDAIDLTKGGDHHLLHLELEDVLDLTGGDKSLLIKTDAGDSVDFDGDWTKVGDNVFTAEDGTTVTISGAGTVSYDIAEDTQTEETDSSDDTTEEESTDTDTTESTTDTTDTESTDSTDADADTESTTDTTTEEESLDDILPGEDTPATDTTDTTTADTSATDTTDTAAAVDPTVQVTVDDSALEVA